MDHRQHSGVTPVRIVTVTDGDSFVAELPDWPEYLGETIGIRIAGIDTPELRTRSIRERTSAIAARIYLRNTLRDARTITLHHITRDKYFRLLASVDVDGHDLADLMIRSGHARRYVGGKRQPW
ncbi:thermonuclease family protein [Escherichia coli]